MTRAATLALSDPAALDPAVVGAKAAALARAKSAGLPVLPGFVLTTAWSERPRPTWRAAWAELSEDGRHPVVVRSSSTAEDGAESSMAGLFTSVIDVGSWDDAVAAAAEVLASRSRAALVDAPMAVLVQRHVTATWGGVLFGADPVTGSTDRLVVSAVAGGPDALVSGAVSGWTAALSRRGRVVDVRLDAGPRPPSAVVRDLARLAGAAATVFGGPQDIEWAVDETGRLHLLQSRPITALHGPVAGPVLGPGPLAETFPEALAPLEQDLWVAPLRDGLRHALALTGTVSPRALRRSAVVAVVDGHPVADLALLGVIAPRRSFLRRLDPRPPARRLAAAWRVGRLRAALPALARDVVEQVDSDLAAVPGVGGLSNADLLAILDNGPQALTALHGHEALAGLFMPPDAVAVTAASAALAVLAETVPEAVGCAEVIERNPVVLALIPPRIGEPPVLHGAGPSGPAPALVDDPHAAALAREALRLRARWVQELTARAAWELGQRLAALGVLPSQSDVRLLTVGELQTAVLQRKAPAALADRRLSSGAPLPAEFRLAADGTAVAVVRRARGRGGAVGAGGGRGLGPVHFGQEPPQGAVLVVDHLDPRLAAVVPRLAGLVAETGSPLSHLAILAREYGVPTVVGLTDATSRFEAGEVVEVDGSAGTVEPSAVLTAGSTA